jgi:hypothetical protein
MTTYTVILLKPRFLPVVGDKYDLAINYEIVDTRFLGMDKKEEVDNTLYGRIVVGISGTLQSMWQLEGINIEKVLVELAKKHINNKLLDGSITENEEIQHTTYNSPIECPINFYEIDYHKVSSFTVSIPEITDSRFESAVTLSANIIDLRDNINAVFGQKFGGRLLALPQERALKELSRQCENETEFLLRVASLCSLVTAIETKYLKISDNNEKEIGSIDKLGIFLRTNFPNEGISINKIMESISSFNQLRRMYPIHTDRADGVLKAYNYFGIEYPINNFQKTWEFLLQNYQKLLSNLLNILRNF